MYRRAACALARLGLLAIAMLCALERASAVEIQKSDPQQCADDDKACVQAWFKEYAAGLIAELKYYAGQEDFLAEMLANPQETLMTAKLSLILIEGGTRFSQWLPLEDESVARNAELDMARYQAIIGSCRDAISGIRTALFDLRTHRENVRAEAGQYLKDATACEKAFALPPVISKLRNPGQPARAAPPAPAVAPQAPMQIKPTQRRP